MNIKKVSEQLGISSDTIRYYERIGLVPPISRDKNGVRNFTDIDIQRLDFIKCMRHAGLSIESLHEYMNLCSLNDDRTIPARKRILEEGAEKLDERIASLQETRAYLQHKIDVYDSQLTQATNDLKLSEE
ncbi:MerR family transcriptional regulator [Ligilactobacillus salivarius]|uniref:MerR family transcriptional regulator n=1 Tax=Ligilactobacillus salivarius TaxID=1624 RepID=A0A1V9R9H3_9LACO|nr:MerR family transcriptional regulator [Ligilactobacillus salivarius]OQQ89835.1 MerR family transcriptional regulator [Ligilactobacillus salivarius]